MATVKNYVRPSRPKSAAQIAKAAENVRLHRERTLHLARLQKMEQAKMDSLEAAQARLREIEADRKEREEMDRVIRERFATEMRRLRVINARIKLLTNAARSAPSYAIWCRINKRDSASYGSAAAFFWRYPQEHPSGLATGRNDLDGMPNRNAVPSVCPAGEVIAV